MLFIDTRKEAEISSPRGCGSLIRTPECEGMLKILSKRRVCFRYGGAEASGIPDEDFYPYGLRHLTDEERIIYYKQVIETEGFDVDPTLVDKAIEFGIIKPVPGDANDERYINHVRCAIKLAKSNVQFVRVVKANYQASSPLIYFLTFDAQDPADHVIKTYQAKLVRKIPDSKSFVEIFRLKPPDPQCRQPEDPSSFYEPMDYEMTSKI